MDIRPYFSYIPYATYLREKTDDIITFSQFEEENLLSETFNHTESGNKYDDNSTLSPLTSEEEMDVMSPGNGSYFETMSTDMSEDIRDGSQYHSSINRREARYRIRDFFKRRKQELKGTLLSTHNMGKVLHKLFEAVVNNIPQELTFLGESGS